MSKPLEWGAAEQTAAAALIELALQEDLGGEGDLTSTALIPTGDTGTVQIVARRPGRLSGTPIGRHALRTVDETVSWEQERSDGAPLAPDQVIATLSGSVCSLLTAERTILNFITHLSGVATLTHQFVEAIAGTRAVILDTRKTLPGWRVLHKYAVRCGGGANHRMGLWDAVLIKDNHLAALAEEGVTSLKEVLTVARERVPVGKPIIVEVDTLDQLQDALPGSPDVVLLDNMGPHRLREAVALRDRDAPDVLLEASGGVTLQTVRDIAAAGVDRISIGALTHSAPALDLGFDWK